MVALTGPSSTTWVPRVAIKRPSEVPPEVDGVVSRPVTDLMLAATASSSSPGWVRNGRPDSAQSMW